MSISVSFNPNTYNKYVLPLLLKYPEFESILLGDFKTYMGSARNDLPSYFGRDTCYTQPEHAKVVGLMHIHLCLPPKKFGKKVPQWDRVCKSGDPENDICLVYVQSEYNENVYSLLAIFSPDAHDKARQPKIMNYLCRVAQDFVDSN